LDSVLIKSIDPETIQSAVRQYAQELRHAHPEILRIIWFGSWINRLPAPGSDVDLCLIVSHPEAPHSARASLYLPAGFPTGIDLFICTSDEFQRL
jgi:DNA polymerase sigma